MYRIDKCVAPQSSAEYMAELRCVSNDVEKSVKVLNTPLAIITVIQYSWQFSISSECLHNYDSFHWTVCFLNGCHILLPDKSTSQNTKLVLQCVDPRGYYIIYDWVFCVLRIYDLFDMLQWRKWNKNPQKHFPKKQCVWRWFQLTSNAHT